MGLSWGLVWIAFRQLLACCIVSRELGRDNACVENHSEPEFGVLSSVLPLSYFLQAPALSDFPHSESPLRSFLYQNSLVASGSSSSSFIYLFHSEPNFMGRRPIAQRLKK